MFATAPVASLGLVAVKELMLARVEAGKQLPFSLEAVEVRCPQESAAASCTQGPVARLPESSGVLPRHQVPEVSAATGA